MSKLQKVLADPEAVRQAIRGLRTWFEFERVLEKVNTLMYSTRANGSVADEKPGKADIVEAHRIRSELESRFGNLRVRVETCDEWTSIDVCIHDKALSPRPPTETHLREAMDRSNLGALFKSKLQANGLWGPKSLVYPPSTGAPELIFEPQANESHGLIKLSCLVEGDDTEWKLWLRAGEMQVPLSSLTPRKISSTLDQLEAATEGFYAVKKPRYAITRSQHGRQEFLLVKTFGEPQWIEDPTRATLLDDWSRKNWVPRLPEIKAYISEVRFGRQLQITKKDTV